VFTARYGLSLYKILRSAHTVYLSVSVLTRHIIPKEFYLLIRAILSCRSLCSIRGTTMTKGIRSSGKATRHSATWTGPPPSEAGDERQPRGNVVTTNRDENGWLVQITLSSVQLCLSCSGRHGSCASTVYCIGNPPLQRKRASSQFPGKIRVPMTSSG
jgi:hypothetical protein